MSIVKADQICFSELNQQIIEGEKASRNICQYVDWLMSTNNPDPPDNGTWVKPSIHPCQKPHKDIVDAHSDYVDLLNTVQRHIRCSTSCCLRKKVE